MSEPARLFVVAAEPSGDALGAGLLAALAARADRPITAAGVGGPRMASQGVRSPFDIRDLSVLGYVEGLRAYGRVVRRADETAALAAAFAPHVAILIDSWGFTLRVAQRLRRQNPDLLIIKYVGPQVWASRPGRAKTLARVADHVLTLQPFEPPYFEAAGLPATFVGHPALEARRGGDESAFRERYGLGERLTVLVAFGSRRAEIERLGPVLFDAAARLRDRHGEGISLIAPLASSVATQVRAMASERDRQDLILMVDEPEKEDAFAAADLAIACSGTVVTELAVAGAPSVVAYRVGGLSRALTRLMMIAPHVSLVNMAAGRRLLPELLFEAATPEGIADAASAWIDDLEVLDEVRREMIEAVQVMRGASDARSASERAADAVIAICREHGAAFI